jgi:hypothetical protein
VGYTTEERRELDAGGGARLHVAQAGVVHVAVAGAGVQRRDGRDGGQAARNAGLAVAGRGVLLAPRHRAVDRDRGAPAPRRNIFNDFFCSLRGRLGSALFAQGCSPQLCHRRPQTRPLFPHAHAHAKRSTGSHKQRGRCTCVQVRLLASTKTYSAGLADSEARKHAAPMRHGTSRRPARATARIKRSTLRSARSAAWGPRSILRART